MQAIYETTVTATGDGRNGHTASDDGLLDIDVRMPPAMGGPGGATNPEQLFAAGYAACFHSALRNITPDKAQLTDSSVSATVALGAISAGVYGLSVRLDVRIPELETEAARALVEQAHAVCPYSNATRGNVEVTLNVVP